MSSPFYPMYEKHIEPGAKERIEKKLKMLPEININRPCRKCIHYDPSCLISCRSSLECNFNHDRFIEGQRKWSKN